MTTVYPPGDPRSQLSRPARQPRRAEGDDVLPFQHVQLADSEPVATTPMGSRSWTMRAQNVVVDWTDLAAGDELLRDDLDETMTLVLAADRPVVVDWRNEHIEVNATSIVIVPPGPTRITSSGRASLLRLFATSASDLTDRSSNRELYEPAPESIAVHEPWPEPVGGSRLRVYSDLDSIPQSSDRMGRIFRSRHVMVNVLYPRVGPRDPRTLSPHDHDDFEQLSIAYEGAYLHHIRAHWGRDRLQWREDQHVESASPSIAIIPPPLLHTSEAVGQGSNRMIDVFAGPRADFSARPGWVLNADDYPMPDGGAE